VLVDKVTADLARRVLEEARELARNP